MESTKSIISISHNDLDGLGCQLVLRWYFEDLHYESVSYSNIHSTLLELRELLIYDRSKRAVIISDLSLKSEDIDILYNICNENPSVRFIVSDHHIRSKEVQNKFNTLPINFIDVHNINKCSALSLYYYYNVQDFKIKKIIDLIDVYDMWRNDRDDFEEALMLNELYENVGHLTFFQGISRYGNLSDDLKSKQLKVQKKVENFTKNIDDNSFIYYDDFMCIAHIDRYKSVLQNYLERPLSIIISSNLNFSIRLSNSLKDFEIEDYTHLFFDYFEKMELDYYYAHRQVFGFNLGTKDIFKDLDNFVDFLKENI